MLALLVMTDGRDTVHEAIRSADEHLGRVEERWIHDDSGDEDRRALLAAAYPTFRIIHAGRRVGFGGAIASAWTQLRARSRADFIFHLEDDFIFHRRIPTDAMIDVLRLRPHLINIALRRQPWNDEERAAGGIVEQHPGDYTEEACGMLRWLEHRRFFTTNPGIYRRSLLDHGWPDGPNSEGHFSLELAGSDTRLRFGYFGARDSGEWCEHIGAERVGTGY